jgi:hygromycin-B 7''-O-kinase
LEHVAAMLPDYIRHTPTVVGEDELAAAILWLHLSWGLGKLTAEPWPGQRHWTAPPASRVLGILRFFAADPPEPWSGLT